MKPFRHKRLKGPFKGGTYMAMTAMLNKTNGMWYPFVIIGREYIPVDDPYVTEELANRRADEIGKELQAVFIRLKIFDPNVADVLRGANENASRH